MNLAALWLTLQFNRQRWWQKIHRCHNWRCNRRPKKKRKSSNSSSTSASKASLKRSTTNESDSFTRDSTKRHKLIHRLCCWTIWRHSRFQQKTAAAQWAKVAVFWTMLTRPLTGPNSSASNCNFRRKFFQAQRAVSPNLKPHKEPLSRIIKRDVLRWNLKLRMIGSSQSSNDKLNITNSTLTMLRKRLTWWFSSTKVLVVWAHIKTSNFNLAVEACAAIAMAVPPFQHPARAHS